MSALPASIADPVGYEVRNLRENLRHIGAWVDHWREDAASRLTPTPSSLESAALYVTISLRALDRIEAEQAQASLAKQKESA